ncbi:MAG: CoA-transferase [Gammaproteobacteria bacterium]
MRLTEKMELVARILRWRLTWNRMALDHRPEGALDPRFVTARKAAALVPDGAVCLSTGMAGNGRCSALFRALRTRFQDHGRPRGLTWIAVGGQGGRGKAPGTVEELGLPGLVSRFIAGHTETVRSMLALADRGELELHVLPQGEMVFCLEAQARGEEEILSSTGLGTFLDPRSGRGSPVQDSAENFVRADGERLAYRLPPLEVAVIAAPWADTHGNIYFRDAAVITENTEAAAAAKANGGKVIVIVGGIVAHDESAVSLDRSLVDAVVVDPYAEQTILSPQRDCWRLFTPGGDGDDVRAIERLRFINRFLRLTPVRGPVECALGRLGADQFARALAPGACVNIGVGFGEEVCRELYESDIGRDITFTSETGVYGGMPAPGIYFGAAVNPRRIESSAWMFHHYQDNLDACILGFLEVDSAGNVNVSRRGPAMSDYVGPGGFPSITNAARNCLFVGSFMQGAQWKLDTSCGLSLVKRGRPKFLPAVDEITFNGRRALEMGKNVWYVTNVGVFRLDAGGLVLERIMPGLDLDRDVRPHCDAAFRVPQGGPAPVPMSVATGEAFGLAWGEGAA